MIRRLQPVQEDGKTVWRILDNVNKKIVSCAPCENLRLGKKNKGTSAEISDEKPENQVSDVENMS